MVNANKADDNKLDDKQRITVDMTDKIEPKYNEKLSYITKGQLISKQNCRAITSSKKQTQDF